MHKENNRQDRIMIVAHLHADMDMNTLKALDRPAYDALHSFLQVHDQAQYDAAMQLKVLTFFARKLKLCDALEILEKEIEIRSTKSS